MEESPTQQTPPVQGTATVECTTTAARDVNTHMAAVTDAQRLDVATIPYYRFVFS